MLNNLAKSTDIIVTITRDISTNYVYIITATAKFTSRKRQIVQTNFSRERTITRPDVPFFGVTWVSYASNKTYYKTCAVNKKVSRISDVSVYRNKCKYDLEYSNSKYEKKNDFSLVIIISSSKILQNINFWPFLLIDYEIFWFIR